MVVCDEAFKGAGKKRGIEIWRIEKFKAVPVPREQYGNFFAGDSYIVLSTKENNEWDVHFWLGKDATQDEYGTAAIKTVELDDLLGGGPVQYREVQDHESSLFLSYFKAGIKYLTGGHASGFHHVDDPKFETRLFQCKGKRNVRVSQVPLTADSLNLGDVFILDTGKDIYVWMPPESGRLERIKGMQMAANIRDHERAGRGTVHALGNVHLDGDWDTNAEFYHKLGGKKAIKSAQQGGLDEHVVRKENQLIALWKVSDASGKMQIQKVAEGPPTENMLDTNDAFILDASAGGIFVWIGKKCNAEERKKAMVYANKYMEEQKKSKFTQIIRVLESGEPAIFTQYFKNSIKNRPTFAPRLFQCSDESGKLSVEEICKFKQEDLDGDDVMVLDTGDKVFLWIGAKANINEKRAAQQTAEKYLKTELSHRPLVTQIVPLDQGHEPVDFTRVFPGWDVTMWARQRSVDDVKKQILKH